MEEIRFRIITLSWSISLHDLMMTLFRACLLWGAACILQLLKLIADEVTESVLLDGGQINWLVPSQKPFLDLSRRDLWIFVKLGFDMEVKIFFYIRRNHFTWLGPETRLCFKNLLKWNSFNIHLSHSLTLTWVPAILCFVVLVVFSFFNITPLIFHQIEQVGTVLNAEFHGLSENDITFNIWQCIHGEN